MQVVAVHPGGIDALAVEERSDPSPREGELLVRVRASSLNFHDLAVVMGLLPTPPGRIPLSDGAGEVLAVGEGVDGVAVGDPVMSLFFPRWSGGHGTAENSVGVPGDHVDGFAAELVAAPATAFTPIPANLTVQEAATLPCAALTAWTSLIEQARIKPGDWVLTQGTGGVSMFACLFAKAAGARVIATSSSDGKLAQMAELGADHGINYRSVPAWGAAALELTGGRGVDAVIEVGGPGTIGQSIDACRVGGHISMIGVLTGISGDVPTATLFAKRLRIDGIGVGSRQDQLDMIRAIEAHDLHPAISHTFPLPSLGEAFSLQGQGGHFGKISIDI